MNFAINTKTVRSLLKDKSLALTLWGWAIPPNAEFVVLYLYAFTATEFVPRLWLPQGIYRKTLSVQSGKNALVKNLFSFIILFFASEQS
jgi:hypothetical protein